MKTRILILLPLLVITASSCAAGGGGRGNRTVTLEVLQNPGSALCLARQMSLSADRYRDSAPRYRKRSAWLGALTTAVGSLTATLVSTLRANDTKTAVGISGGVATAGLGVLTAVHASGSDPGAYVSAADGAVARYIASQFRATPPTNDSLLYVQAGEIKARYPEFADFSLVQAGRDLTCNQIEPLRWTSPPAAANSATKTVP